RLKFLWNTRSVIDDRKPYGVASRLDKELNFVARPRESRRVGNKVRKDVPYLARINRNVRKIRRNAGNQPQVIGFNQQAEVRQDIFNETFRRDDLKSLPHLTRFETRKIEEIVDHAKQALGVFSGRKQQLKLFCVERPNFLLEQKMKSHPNAR